jgi:hypothetical protein
MVYLEPFNSEEMVGTNTPDVQGPYGSREGGRLEARSSWLLSE